MIHLLHQKKYVRQGALKTDRGITLAELLISTAIFVMITAGAYAVAVTSQGHWDTNKTSILLHQELRKAAEAMLNDLRLAGSSEGTLNSSLPRPLTGAVSASSIAFKRLNTIGSSGNLNWDTNSVQYALVGTDPKQLIRTQGGNSRVLANNISNLTFTRRSTAPDILEITIRGEDTTDNGRDTIEYELLLKVELRN